MNPERIFDLCVQAVEQAPGFWSTKAEILGKSRQEHHAKARHFLVGLLHELGAPACEIARLTGKTSGAARHSIAVCERDRSLNSMDRAAFLGMLNFVKTNTQ